MKNIEEPRQKQKVLDTENSEFIYLFKSLISSIVWLCNKVNCFKD